MENSNHFIPVDTLIGLNIYNSLGISYIPNLLITTSLIVFMIGVSGIFFNRKLILSILLAIELTLLGINLLVLTYAACLDDNVGVVLGLYILCVAAAESAIGLALIIVWYRIRRTTNVQHISLLNG